MSKSTSKPFPLEKSLRDLALLRASSLDLTSLLPPSSSANPEARTAVEASVTDSYELVREARMVLKVRGRNDVESQGSRLEVVRAKLDDLLGGLQT